MSRAIDQVSASAWADAEMREAAVRFWLDSKPSQYTRDNCLRHITLWFGWCEAHDVPPGSPRRSDVEAWQNSFVIAGHSPATIAQRLSAVSGYYDFWWQRNVVTGNPAAPAGATPGMGRRTRRTVPVGPYGDSRLVVIREAEPVTSRGGAKHYRAVLCRCECSTMVIIRLSNLARTRSCGCLRRDVNASRVRRGPDQTAQPDESG
jgi:integrase/recombinase XerD